MLSGVIIIMVAHETGQIATGDEPLNNIARVSNSREGRVSNSGINVINGKKTKNTEDCFDNSITGVCAAEKKICSNDLHLSGRPNSRSSYPRFDTIYAKIARTDANNVCIVLLSLPIGR